MKLHEKIRNIRKTAKISLKELHRRIVFHYGDQALGYWTLSRIELGKHEHIRLSSLEQICTALNISLGELYEGVERDNVENMPLIKRNQRRGGYTFNEKAKFDIVTPSNLDFWILELTILPGGETTPKKSTAEGTSTEIAYVIHGKVLCYIEDTEYELKKGDTLTFDNRSSSYYKNISNAKSVLLIYQNPKKI